MAKIAYKAANASQWCTVCKKIKREKLANQIDILDEIVEEDDDSGDEDDPDKNQDSGRYILMILTIIMCGSASSEPQKGCKEKGRLERNKVKEGYFGMKEVE